MADRDFWAGRRVFLTGHTGFKGSWLHLWLRQMRVDLSCYALTPPTDPSLAEALNIEGCDQDDIRDRIRLTAAVKNSRADVVIHLAAQALVPVGFADPVKTYETNAIGTLNLLDAVEQSETVRTVLLITSDKVYRVTGGDSVFDEGDALGGEDPYSVSKVAAEHLAALYRPRLAARGIRLATARAGNVIGGGDWAAGRLVPDTIRAWMSGVSMQLRQPSSTRPWQHVLDVLDGYLRFAEALSQSRTDRPTLNFAPRLQEHWQAKDVIEHLQQGLGAKGGWRPETSVSMPETFHLSLDASAAATELGWATRLNTAQALDWVAAFARAHANRADLTRLCLEQIAHHQELPNNVADASPGHRSSRMRA